jgi:hypothetical protein
MKVATLTEVNEARKAALVTSVRQAFADCNVAPPVVRRWLSLGLIPKPPWTAEQLREVRDLTDPEHRWRGNRAAHGTMTRWMSMRLRSMRAIPK